MAKTTKTIAGSTTTDSMLVKNFKAARRVSTPIIAVETPDPAATIAQLAKALNGDAPVCQWDIVRGLRGLNKLGTETLSRLQIDPMQTINAVEALMQLEKLPDYSAVFFHNAHHYLKDAPVTQAIWNLRDEFKLNRRTLILLGPSFQIPSEIAGDVVVLDEPLPTRIELEATLDQQHVNAELPAPTGPARAQALDAIVGLPSFAAEQVVAMSLTRNGLDHDSLWERKRKAIEATDGLRVWRGGESFADLRGIDNVQGFMQQLVDVDAFGVVVFIDEMDKALAGGMSDHTGDSGVSKDQVGVLLSYIEDTGSVGVLLAGIAGAGKSALAKATGNAAGKPTIVFDLGGMKGGTVGQSERQIRAALKVVTATAEGRVLFIGTANRTTIFTPEINRRFADQWFFDLPDRAARVAIGDVYARKFGLAPGQLVDAPWHAQEWTGAEIKRACERAALLKRTVLDVARYIVPSAVSAAKVISELRANAAGRFLNANAPGLYQSPVVERSTTSGGRAIDVSSL